MYSIKDNSIKIAKLNKERIKQVRFGLDLLGDEIILRDLMKYAQSRKAKKALYNLAKALEYKRRNENN